MGKIILVLAKDERGGIGNKDGLPWGNPSPADISRFRKITLGKTLLMGRKTYEIIWGKFGPLKDRKENIVLTRNLEWKGDGMTVCHSKAEILELAKSRDIYVIGGGEIYETFQPNASMIYLTEVRGQFESDTSFQWHDKDAWKISAPPIFLPKGPITEHPLLFNTFERRTPLP